MVRATWAKKEHVLYQTTSKYTKLSDITLLMYKHVYKYQTVNREIGISK